MQKAFVLLLAAAFLTCGQLARATLFGRVRGIVHDPQHRPIPDAVVRLDSATSHWSQTASTNQDGEFAFPAVPIGDYIVTTDGPGFEKSAQNITVVSDSSPVLHFMLRIAAVSETTTVSAESETVAANSATPVTLDDQRNTLSVGFEAALPWRMFAASNVYYGSGFSNGQPPPDYLPGHTSVDVSLGRKFGENVSVSVTGLNVANRHLLIDNSETFGGVHYNRPREIYVQFRWRFHY